MIASRSLKEQFDTLSFLFIPVTGSIIKHHLIATCFFFNSHRQAHYMVLKSLITDCEVILSGLDKSIFLVEADRSCITGMCIKPEIIRLDLISKIKNSLHQ